MKHVNVRCDRLVGPFGRTVIPNLRAAVMEANEGHSSKGKQASVTHMLPFPKDETRLVCFEDDTHCKVVPQAEVGSSWAMMVL